MEIATDSRTLAQWLREAETRPVGLAVYHNCQDEPVELRTILDGLPNDPWFCFVCKRPANTSTELTYNFVRFPLDTAEQIVYNRGDAE